MTRVTGTRKPSILSSLGTADELKSILRDDWSSVHLIARGNILMHHINGRAMSMVLDDDSKGRATKGLIGVQVHVGPPMQVRYRNWRLREK